MAGKILFGLLLCLSSGPALAQAIQSDAQNDDSASDVADIVVTATRREARLQDVPISITAVSSDQLASAGAFNPRDLTRLVPGLNMAQTGYANLPVIRGVGGTSAIAGMESPVAFYVDGVYYPDSGANVQDLLEVDRIEVLRGPQGTLFGRNATGGLVNIITKDPRQDFGGNFNIWYGSFDTFRASGYVTTGLADGLAMDLAVGYRKSDGYIKDRVRGGYANPSESFGVRSKILYKPTTDMWLKASFAHENLDDPTAFSQFVVNGNTIGRPSATVAIADGPFDSSMSFRTTIKARVTRGDFQTHFGLGGVNLETTTSYSRAKRNWTSDLDRAPSANGAARSRNATTRTFTNEVRLLSDGTQKIDWILGAYYFKNKATGPTTLYVTDFAGATLFTVEPYVRSESWAVFGEASWNLTDQLSIVGGLRYTDEKLKFRQTRNGIRLFDTSTTENKLTPRASIQYKLTRNTNVYATYSRGFKSAAFNSLGTSPTPVRPETLDSYEIGVKSVVSSEFTINTAAFYYKYKNLQATALQPNGTFVLQNAAQMKMKGVEIEAIAQPTPDLTFRATAVYNDAYYASFPGAANFVPRTNAAGVPIGGNNQVPVDVSGNQLVKSPKVTWSAGINYSREVGIGRAGISADIFASARVFWSTAHELVQPAYEMVNGELYWQPRESIRLSVWGTNLTNAKVAREILSAGQGTFRVNQAPRQYGVSASLKF